MGDAPGAEPFAGVRPEPMVLSLAGRTALVTGGGTGIGKAIAAELATAGARVTICGPDAGVLDAACAELAASGLPGVRAFEADVTDEASVAAAVEAAADEGRLDIAVANAGTAMPGSLLHLTTAHWMVPLGVNVLGTAHTVKHAARLMRDRGGAIVTVSSIAAARPAAFMNGYSVSKAAVDELTRCAAAEFGRFGIRVNGVRPGWMSTESAAAATTPDNLAIMRAGTPLAGDGADSPLGDPADVARAVVFLASDHASWITGQLIGVCGGSSLPPPSGDFAHAARFLFAEEMDRDFGAADGSDGSAEPAGAAGAAGSGGSEVPGGSEVSGASSGARTAEDTGAEGTGAAEAVRTAAGTDETRGL
ncbi:SDR family NAD(P)-dependent oxidoreductase [Yinghuangia sp. YIM S09857]|uniref:SDR family NAD(P)-dependent oxidoreductase n=1 Tax=Yinghuangia sp. YIM S09857 TaxID=3436929 RepID=UPI003F5382B3